MKYLKIVSWIILFTINLVAQNVYFNADSSEAAFENGKLYLPFNNSGVLAYVDVGPRGLLMQYEGISTIFSAGFYIGGYSNNKRWMDGNSFTALWRDFRPGLYNTKNNLKAKKIFHLSINQEPFSKSWREWKYAVELGADYYDGDGNGEYDPIDKNNNGFWEINEDRPGLMYDNTFFCVYNDGNPPDFRIFTELEPQGIEIRQTIFASNSILEFQKTIFVKYSIVNTGLKADTLDQVFFSIFMDPDLGNMNNDLVGCDTLLNSSFVYNDSTEVSFNADDQPVLYSTFVKLPDNNNSMRNFQPRLPSSAKVGLLAHTSPYGTSPTMEVPSLEEFIRHIMGADNFGSPVNPCDFFLGNVVGIDCESVNNKLWFSGDPQTQIGWLDTLKTDQRNFLTTDLFRLIKNEPQEIIIAFTIGEGYNDVSSFDMARYRVGEILKEAEAGFPKAFVLSNFPNNPEEVEYNFTIDQNFPNPFNPSTTIRYSIKGTNYLSNPSNNKLVNVKLVVFDALGRKVATLLDEPKAPGDYQIVFDGSNLASGFYFYKFTAGKFSSTKKMMLLR